MLWEYFVYNPETHGSNQVDPTYWTDRPDEFIFLICVGDGRSPEKLVDAVCEAHQCGRSQYNQGVPRVWVCGEERQGQQSYSHVLQIITTILLALTDRDHFEGGPDGVETELSPRKIVAPD